MQCVHLIEENGHLFKTFAQAIYASALIEHLKTLLAQPLVLDDLKAILKVMMANAQMTQDDWKEITSLIAENKDPKIIELFKWQVIEMGNHEFFRQRPFFEVTCWAAILIDCLYHPSEFWPIISQPGNFIKTISNPNLNDLLRESSIQDLLILSSRKAYLCDRSIVSIKNWQKLKKQLEPFYSKNLQMAFSIDLEEVSLRSWIENDAGYEELCRDFTRLANACSQPREDGINLTISDDWIEGMFKNLTQKKRREKFFKHFITPLHKNFCHQINQGTCSPQLMSCLAEVRGHLNTAEVMSFMAAEINFIDKDSAKRACEVACSVYKDSVTENSLIDVEKKAIGKSFKAFLETMIEKHPDLLAEVNGSITPLLLDSKESLGFPVKDRVELIGKLVPAWYGQMNDIYGQPDRAEAERLQLMILMTNFSTHFFDQFVDMAQQIIIDISFLKLRGFKECHKILDVYVELWNRNVVKRASKDPIKFYDFMMNYRLGFISKMMARKLNKENEFQVIWTKMTAEAQSIVENAKPENSDIIDPLFEKIIFYFQSAKWPIGKSNEWMRQTLNCLTFRGVLTLDSKAQKLADYFNGPVASGSLYLILHGSFIKLFEEYIHKGDELNLVRAWTMLIALHIKDLNQYPLMNLPGMFCDIAKKLIFATSKACPHLLKPMLDQLIREGGENRPFTRENKSENWKFVSDEVCTTAFKELLLYKTSEDFVTAFENAASFLQLALKHHCFAGNYESYHLFLSALFSSLLKKQDHITKEQFEKMALRLGTLMTFKSTDANDEQLKLRAFSIETLTKSLIKANRKDVSDKITETAKALKIIE
jgi:hypothetical protein